MKAVVISEPGGYEVLNYREMPDPQPRPGQVLITVKAAGVNRSDIYSRTGAYGDFLGPEIPGLEVAGIVRECGPEAHRWKKGDRVVALLAGGGYAQQACVDERICLPMPESLSFEEGAALPEAIFTVWFNVFKQARLRSGEIFLVHGGSSGIGVIAIQMSVALGSAAFATAGTEEKCRFCRSLGAIKAVNYKKEDFETALKDEHIDVILDMVGGDYTQKNLRILDPGGRLCLINAMQGMRSQILISEIMRKNLIITGSMLKPQSTDVKASLCEQIRNSIWPLVNSGKIRPIVHRVFSLAEAAEAQRLMESGDHMGKIILQP